MAIRRLILRSLFFIVSAVIIAELFFTFILPADSRPVYYQDSETKLLFFDRDFRSTGIHRYGNPPRRGGEWVVNNSGWASPYDYQIKAARDCELIGLYGDSYVVGLNTDYENHLDVLLTEQLENYDVYSFAMGGMMLMEYVKLIEYSEEVYDPMIHVIVINGGDIRTSIRNYSIYSLYYQINFDDDDELEIIAPIEFSENALKRYGRRSALLRFLRYHRGVTLLSKGRGRVDPNANDINGEVISAFEEDESYLYLAAEYMLQAIVDTVNGDLVIFVLDSPRGPVYRHEDGNEGFQDCNVIRDVASQYSNVICLDLLPIYKEAYARDGRRFNDIDNSHWNEYGNYLVATSILNIITNNIREAF